MNKDNSIEEQVIFQFCQIIINILLMKLCCVLRIYVDIGIFVDVDKVGITVGKPSVAV